MLEIRDLNVHYGGIHALKGVSLRVEDGEIVTLIGANGAGKSTTLRTVSGLKKPTSGHVLVDGTDIEEGIDDEDAPRKRQTDDEIEIVEELDEYLARRAGGRRVKEIPDVTKFLA